MSDAALDDVKGRSAMPPTMPLQDGTSAYVSGTPSIFVDLQDAMAQDYSIVFPIAAVLIMVILALLLRNLVALWYPMAAVELGFAAALGAMVIVFQQIMGEAGLIFMLPIYIHLLMTTLGIDYNILLVARLREEACERREPRASVAQAVNMPARPSAPQE